MKILDQKSFSGTYYQPPFKVYDLNGLVAFVNYWGDPCEELILENIENTFVKMIDDENYTITYSLIDSLSSKANILLHILKQLNENIFQSCNQKKMTSLVEMTLIFSYENQMFFAQCGNKNMFLYRNNKWTCLYQSNTLADLYGVNSSCLPSQFLGGYNSCDITIKQLPVQKEDHFLLTSIKSFHSKNLNFNDIFSEIIDSNPNKPTWATLLKV